MSVSVGVSVDVASPGPGRAGPGGPISFVGAAEANGVPVAVSFAAGDCGMRWNGHTAQALQTPAGYTALFAPFVSASPACRRLGWTRMLLPGDVDPSMTGISHLLVYRGCRVKPGSVSVLTGTGAAAVVPAQDPGSGEWAFGSLYCREVQTAVAMQAAVPGDGLERFRRAGGASLNPAIYFDDGGTGDGWPEMNVAIASSVWVAVTGILEPA